MKVVTCFIADGLREETVEALHELWPNERDELILQLINSHDQTEYSRVIAKLWSEGEDFAIVEPDIVIRADVVEAFRNCSCEYGCFPYAWTTDVGPALGCTWFRQSFLAKYPTACAEASPFSWRQFDVVLMRHVLARKYGEQPHVHLPEVVHLNEAKRLLPEADPAPLMEVPLW